LGAQWRFGDTLWRKAYHIYTTFTCLPLGRIKLKAIRNGQEVVMAKINIAALDVESLLELRSRIDAKLGEHKQTLQKQLERLDVSAGDGRRKGNGVRATKGRKVAAKYRSRKDPKLTWAGRGATPTWMREEMKGTKLKKENFLIK
jgi:DNA-binding protein H-NS